MPSYPQEPLSPGTDVSYVDFTGEKNEALEKKFAQGLRVSSASNLHQ